MAKVSIVTVCKNEAARIEATLESVTIQTFKDFEWIVIDGASSDGTYDVLSKFRSHIKHLVSEPDEGVFFAQNKGARLARGEYLLFLNGGDTLASENALSQLASTTSCEDLIRGDIDTLDADGKRTSLRAPGKLTLDFLMTSSVWHPATLIKRSLFESIGPYDTSLRIVADYDFFFKALLQARATEKHVAETIAVFRTDGFSSRKDIRQLQVMERRQSQERYLAAPVLAYYDNQCSLQSQPTFLARRLVAECAAAAIRRTPKPIKTLAKMAMNLGESK